MLYITHNNNDIIENSNKWYNIKDKIFYKIIFILSTQYLDKISS